MSNGVLDFLFDGKPPASVTTYGTSTENMPKWLSDYTQGLIGRANAVAAEPYQAYNGPRVAPISQDQNNAFAQVRSNIGSYQPALAQANQMTQQAGALSPVGAASPYMASAGRNFPGAVSQYMDPYIQNVLDRNSLQTTRTLNENLLPSVAKMFGASNATPRSTQMRSTVDRGVRDLTEGLNSQNLAALSGAYTTAGQLFDTDAARQAQLASTAGNLAGQEGALKLQSGQQMGALGELGQSLNYRDVAQQEAIGQEQQQQQQRNMDTAYQDFLEQRNYPRNTIDWMSSVVRGLPTPTQTSVTKTGPGDVFQPSPLSQLASMFTGIGGLAQAVQPRQARGGRIRVARYARGGVVRRPARGALSYY